MQEHYGTNVSQTLGFPTVLTNPVDLGTPNVSILGFEGIGEPINYPQDRHDSTFHLADNLAWNHGRHQFKFGADIRRLQLNSYIDFLARGEWFFQGGMSGDPMVALAQLLSGMPDYAVAVKGDTFNGLRSTGLDFYIQDDIRVVPRLLLNVGLRYEYNSPPVEVHDRFSVPDLSRQLADLFSLSRLPVHPGGHTRGSREPRTTGPQQLRAAHWAGLAAAEDRALGGSLRVRHLL